ncbi:AI-2E family transporter [Mycolicibacterium arseniciresistens]|uniref:AI-2E family transporter n=1 Tax=Mycolicibacterium arseniciresistens TaxID=3062257 RepID=A0ABT8UMY0_9MYCO|nr:AI-2E family transporter [Mycolicibacterium arseniciresistens]MDO3639168.1 AI-2E family transporter [Mycolicibacterium arseniciresistens]
MATTGGHEFTDSQKRALAIATVIALAFAAYFLRTFFILVVVAAVVAYLFNPLYERCRRRFGTGLSATLTLLAVIAAIIVPVSGLVFFAVVQITSMVSSVSAWMARTDLGALGTRAIDVVNRALARVPLLDDFRVTPDLLQERTATIAQHAGEYLLGILQGAVGGLVGGVTAAVLFLYVFISLLTNRDRVIMVIRKLNPLGEEITDLYLEKMGAMVRGTVFGQFVIALAQGFAGAVSIYIAGFHQGFFVFAILLTALSVIPLGGGILSIPVGIGMMLFGNVFGGIFVIAFHLLVVTNIDNVLRPILVPRQARLDSALMLLAVFAGIAMWGFWGIVIGPVVMIVVVTTVTVYLAVYKGVPLDQFDEEGEEKKPGRLRKLLTRARRQAPAAEPEHDADDGADGPAPEPARPAEPRA